MQQAGQLDGYRCTIHWENRAGFMERFPDVECTGNVFEIDRKRYTCAGGTTSIDLMLEIVRADRSLAWVRMRGANGSGYGPWSAPVRVLVT